jgi:hypothetical protein
VAEDGAIGEAEAGSRRARRRYMQFDRDEFERLMKVISDAQEELDELLSVGEDAAGAAPKVIQINREWLDRWDRAASRRDAAEKDLIALLRGASGMGSRPK